MRRERQRVGGDDEAIDEYIDGGFGIGLYVVGVRGLEGGSVPGAVFVASGVGGLNMRGDREVHDHRLFTGDADLVDFGRKG